MTDADQSYIRYSVLERPGDIEGELKNLHGDNARVVIEAMERLKGGRLAAGDLIAGCRVHDFYIITRDR